MLKAPDRARAEMLLSVCNRRLRGGVAEDEGRGQAARVPADGDPADLHPRGVEAWDRLSVRPAQHPAARVHGEPAHRVRYGWRDFYGHKGRNAQGPGLPTSRGSEFCTRGDPSIVLLQGAEESFTGQAPFSEPVRKLREARSLDDGSSRAPCRLDHLIRSPLAHAAFEPSGVEHIPSVESWLECRGPCQGRLRPVRALVGVAFAAGVDSHGVAAVELRDLHESFRRKIGRGSWQVAAVELVEPGACECALLQRRPKTVASTPRVSPHPHPSRSPDYVVFDQLGVAGEATGGKDDGVSIVLLLALRGSGQHAGYASRGVLQ